ncbi:MAG: VOC family protein [Alphaproteobacteria bacterium]|nr:VOC family protein [Alphaproteobacteria bacterium]
MHFNKLIPELLVSDIETSIKFYLQDLGFTTKYSRKDEGFAFLEKEGAQIMLEQLQPNNRFTNTIPDHPFGRGINFQIDIADVDALYSNLQSKGYPIFSLMEEKWYRCDDVLEGDRQFVVADPDGYLLRFSTGIGQRPA